MGLFCGTDIVEIKRIENILVNQGDAFLNKVYTVREIEYCNLRKATCAQSLAARFCAKEAVVKALGTGIAKGVGLKNVEILNNENGRPYAILHGEALRIFESLGLKSLDVSLSHCKEYATAVCVMI